MEDSSSTTPSSAVAVCDDDLATMNANTNEDKMVSSRSSSDSNNDSTVKTEATAFEDSAEISSHEIVNEDILGLFVLDIHIIIEQFLCFILISL